LKDSIESIITRGISILSKFLLIGFLVKELSLSDYGNFQLISYFILFSTTVFGLEYYNLSNRNVAFSTEKYKIYNFHFNFFLTTLGVILVLQVVSFYVILPSHLLSIYNFIIIFFISLCDYLSQEIYRYLMINKKFRKANIQLIYKSFFFLIFVVAYKYMFNEIDFTSVLLLMLFSYILLLFLAILTFKKVLFYGNKLSVERLSLNKIKKTVIKLIPFITLILFVKGIEFSDKFIIGKILGSKEVGIYSFLYTMGSVMNIFIVSGFYLIYLPELIIEFKKDKAGFKRILLKFSKLNIAFSILIFITIKATETIVFSLIGKHEFFAFTDLLSLILGGFFLYNISLIPHLFLYVSNNEKSIMIVTGIALIINVILTFCYVKVLGVKGVAYSFICTYAFMFISKSIISFKIWRQGI
jgi:O-antigen/teichoic acid export membrane protein